jgi:hypothetical protein
MSSSAATTPERAVSVRAAHVALALLLCALLLVGPWTPAARAENAGLPNPCDLPVVSNVCGAIGSAASSVASATGEFVMRGVTEWVTDAAVWVTGKVGDLVNNTTSPDLTASWFQGEYGAMLAVAGALALLMLMLAVIQSVLRQDVWMLIRAAFGYLPMAFILSAVAITATGLLIAITDEISAAAVGSLGAGQSSDLLQSVGDAYKNALDQSSGIPLFAVFLGAIVLAIGAFVLWLEMIIRDAAIYICVFFLPLTFVGMIWPATSRWARRLVELLVAIILAKFVIVAILSLASAALTNTTAPSGDSATFEQMIAGAALLVLAAWSPFALLRLIPMMEIAAASVTSQRASMSRAAGSAGIQTPAAYMRQAMDRNSRPSTSPANATTGGTAYWQSRSTEQSSEPTTGARQGGSAGGGTRPGAQAGTPSSSSGGTVFPVGQQRSTAPSSGSSRGSAAAQTDSPPVQGSSSPPPPAQPPRRPEPPPPSEGGRT